jgi:hypothetical protein
LIRLVLFLFVSGLMLPSFASDNRKRIQLDYSAEEAQPRIPLKRRPRPMTPLMPSRKVYVEAPTSGEINATSRIRPIRDREAEKQMKSDKRQNQKRLQDEILDSAN